MYKLRVVITGGKDQFGAWIDGYSFITSAGDTLDDAKKGIRESLDLMMDSDPELASVLGGRELDFIFDITGAIKYYRQFIDYPGMNKITGVHPKQLWSYANGYKQPRKETAQKIIENLNNFGKELSGLTIKI